MPGDITHGDDWDATSYARRTVRPSLEQIASFTQSIAATGYIGSATPYDTKAYKSVQIVVVKSTVGTGSSPVVAFWATAYNGAGTMVGLGPAPEWTSGSHAAVAGAGWILGIGSASAKTTVTANGTIWATTTGPVPPGIRIYYQLVSGTDTGAAYTIEIWGERL